MLQFAMITIGALACVRTRPIGLPDWTTSVSVLVHILQRVDDRVMRLPIARGLAKRGIDDQVVGILADREHVL